MIILKADARTPINDMMNSLQWDKLDQQWHKQLLVIVYKCLLNLSPSYLSNQFEFVHNNHSHLTRNHTSNTLAVPKFKTNSGLRTFHVRAAYAWNNLPVSIRNEMDNMTVRQFRLKIDEI